MRWIAAFFVLLTVSACSHRSRERQQRDQNSVAFKAGEAAHEIAKKAAGAAAEAGRELQENARKAREGWNAKERQDREKTHQSQ